MDPLVQSGARLVGARLQVVHRSIKPFDLVDWGVDLFIEGLKVLGLVELLLLGVDFGLLQKLPDVPLVHGVGGVVGDRHRNQEDMKDVLRLQQF